MLNEDTLYLNGYNFKLKYSTHKLEEIVVYEDLKIPLQERCDCSSCEEMNKTEENVCCKSSDLTIQNTERFNNESQFNL